MPGVRKEINGLAALVDHAGDDPPPSENMATWPGGGATTQASLEALIVNDTYDAIEIEPGTYSDAGGTHSGEAFSFFLRLTRTRPLEIRAQSPLDKPIFSGSLGSGLYGFMYLGANEGDSRHPTYGGYPSSPTTDITLKNLKLNNYTIGPQGVVYLGWVQRITLDGLESTGCTNGTGSDSTSHFLYISSDDFHRSSDITATNISVTAASGRHLNACQIYHTPSPDRVTLTYWTVAGCNRAAYLWGNPTAVLADRWTIGTSNATFDCFETSAGTVSNCTSTGSGTMTRGVSPWINTSILDGGGNSAS